MRVVATAGHVDHGKSSLIVRLTGIDPDRWEEEKRRGLTIDLGFAWTTLPSGAEVGFVDVPGHERFVRNMLAGVGPVRLVLFVVAADEGWKPQSEEHLEIVDVLGADAAVVALTKADLVDEDVRRRRGAEVAGRLAGTVLEGAPVVACSSRTGEGIDELAGALYRMVAAAPPPEDRGRPRLDVDRSFTMRGAGTVVTGTLTGGSLSVGDTVAVLPSGARARIRSLQTHRHSVDVARPVSRVAANLAGLPRDEIRRGDVVGQPGRWRPTTQLDVEVRPVRSFDEALTARGAYKLYLGTAERDVRLRLHDGSRIEPGGEGFARLRLSEPVVAAFGDRFVLREAGRRRTVAGGRVLDPHPPRRLDASVLARRAGTEVDDLPGLVVEERAAVRAVDLAATTGAEPDALAGTRRIGPWWVSDLAHAAVTGAAIEHLEGRHASNTLTPGVEAVEVRAGVRGRVPELPDEALDAVLADLERTGAVVREDTLLRLPGHRVSLGEREADAERLVDRIAAAEPTPPSVPDLVAEGHDRDLIDACVRVGRLAGVSRDLVLTPAFLARAEDLARQQAAAPPGMTVSGFREALGTTRKYALPILAALDERGITRRDGDVRRRGGG